MQHIFHAYQNIYDRIDHFKNVKFYVRILVESTALLEWKMEMS